MLASREEAHGIDFPEPGELFKDGNELRKPLQVGCLVNAVDAGKLRSGKMLGDDLVCPDHHLLDKRCRGVLPAKLHALRPSHLVELNARLGLAEVDAALALALCMSKRGEARQLAKMRLDESLPLSLSMLTALRCRRFAFPFEHFERLAISKARVRADEGRVNLVARKLRPLVDIQIDRHGAAHFARGERAQPARELLGDHRDHPIDQIHARAAAPRR